MRLVTFLAFVQCLLIVAAGALIWMAVGWPVGLLVLALGLLLVALGWNLNMNAIATGFYEDDEPIEDIKKAWEQGEKGRTGIYFDVSSGGNSIIEGNTILPDKETTDEPT